MTSDIHQYVEFRLNNWARWASYNNPLNTLDYADQSIIHQLSKNGGYVAKAQGAYVEPENPKAEELDNIISEMGFYQKNLAGVIRVQYTETGSQKEKSQKVGISPAQYKINLKMAKSWISGKLIDKFLAKYSKQAA